MKRGLHRADACYLSWSNFHGVTTGLPCSLSVISRPSCTVPQFLCLEAEKVWVQWDLLSQRARIFRTLQWHEAEETMFFSQDETFLVALNSPWISTRTLPPIVETLRLP